MKRVLAGIRAFLGSRLQVTVDIKIPLVMVRGFSLCFMLASLALAGVKVWESPIPKILRDAVVVVYAHEMAGDPIPFEADNNLNVLYETRQTWDIRTNSIWLLEHTTLIAPFMSYEGLISQTKYPALAVWVPATDDRSLHVLGWAMPEDGLLFMNERMLNDNRWNDERQALSTFVHELIHLQMGAFSEGTSEQLESATSAGTIEVLAGLCNYQMELACLSYWSEIEDLTSASLNVRLNALGAGWVYDLFADAFLRDADREQVVRKSLRFWAKDPEALQGIRQRYGQHPWEAHVIPGICGGKLDTGNMGAELTETGSTRYHILGMEFDDTREMMGLLTVLLCTR